MDGFRVEGEWRVARSPQTSALQCPGSSGLYQSLLPHFRGRQKPSVGPSAWRFFSMSHWARGRFDPNQTVDPNRRSSQIGSASIPSPCPTTAVLSTRGPRLSEPPRFKRHNNKRRSKPVSIAEDRDNRKTPSVVVPFAQEFDSVVDRFAARKPHGSAKPGGGGFAPGVSGGSSSHFWGFS